MAPMPMAIALTGLPLLPISNANSMDPALAAVDSTRKTFDTFILTSLDLFTAQHLPTDSEKCPISILV
jgi:hypothetical protein